MYPPLKPHIMIIKRKHYQIIKERLSVEKKQKHSPKKTQPISKRLLANQHITKKPPIAGSLIYDCFPYSNTLFYIASLLLSNSSQSSPFPMGVPGLCISVMPTLRSQASYLSRIPLFPFSGVAGSYLS